MISNLPGFINKALFFSLVFLVFLTPLFFLPVSGYLEFNKQALLVGLLVVGYLLLALRMVVNRELKFVRTELDLPIFLIFGVCFTSAVFSVSPATSFLGQHGVFHGGVLSLVLYIGLYYLVVNVGRSTITGLLLSILGSSFFLSFLAILQYFEIYVFPWEFTHQRFWTPIGGVKILAAYLLIAVPLVIRLFLKAGGIKKGLVFVVLVVNLTALFLVSGKGGAFRSFLSGKYRSLSVETGLDWQTSWQVANSVLGVRPLLGSGPGTFFSDFTLFKPQSFNEKPFWNVNFDRPANEWFEILATLGVLGIAAWVYLWAKIFKFASVDLGKGKKGDKRRRSLFLSLSLLIFLITTFFVIQTTAVAVFFWVLLALFAIRASLTEEVVVKAEAVITDFKGKKEVRKVPLFKIFAGCLLFFSCFFSYFYFFRFYRAGIDYQKAVSQFNNNKEEAFKLALSASRANPLNDVYQTGLATANLGVASLLSEEASPNASEVQEFVSRAVAAGKRAVQLNPRDARNWANLAGFYQSLLEVDPVAAEQTVNSFNQAINLDPMNPVLRHQLGNFLLRMEQREDAIDQFFAAIRLKPDYAQVHYDLAQAYRAEGDLDMTRRELETVLTLVRRDTPEYETVARELETLPSP